MRRKTTKPVQGNLYAEEEAVSKLAKLLHRSAPDKMGVHTGQETAILFRAACEGPKLRADYKGKPSEYYANSQAGTLTYQTKALPHKVVLYAKDGEDMDVLLELCRDQDTDTAYLATYLTNLLSPNGLTYHIDIYDTAKAIGLRVTKLDEKGKLMEMRRVWQGLRWLSSATVVGSRTGTYTEGRGKEKRTIPTRVEAPLLQLVRWWMPEQAPFPGMLGEVIDEQFEALYMGVPRIVELRLSEEWWELISATSLGEFLGGIKKVMELPGQQPTGAWARSIALSLASLWRRKAEHYLDALAAAKSGQPPSVLLPRLKRSNLISDYRPVKAPLDKLMQETDPARAVEYWGGALQLLVECGFLMPYGDALSKSEALMRRNSEGNMIGNRQGWIIPWADSLVTLLPGSELEEALRLAIKKDMPK